MPQDVKFSSVLDAKSKSELPLGGQDEDRDRRLQLLYELPLQFAQIGDLTSLFSVILDRVIELIPVAERGALLVIDPPDGKLALRASIPEDEPPISRTLIRRAAREASGFIWSRYREVEESQSIHSLGIETGMYAPLLWKGAIQGVVCVDTQSSGVSFTDDDLRFLLSVAHYAAAAVANQQLQHDLEQNKIVLQRLLTNFSPRLRGKLVEKAKLGSLEPGGEKSNVTLLMSDIRGFTKLTDGMDAAIVVEMLNDYYPAYVDAIFARGGTVDKFIGDAILAVFGSPEPDEDQQHNAIAAAIAIQAATRRINDERRRRGLVSCDLGIGLHFGEVLHGFIGAEDRLEFTVIGDTVNQVKRFCDGANGGEILISPELSAFVGDRLDTEQVTIPTKHEGGLNAFRIV